jgi:hypothetical protein
MIAPARIDIPYLAVGTPHDYPASFSRDRSAFWPCSTGAASAPHQLSMINTIDMAGLTKEDAS